MNTLAIVLAILLTTGFVLMFFKSRVLYDVAVFIILMLWLLGVL